MNEDQKGPLMFINSIQTTNKKSTGQQVYDSRNPKKILRKTIVEEPVSQIKEIKLDEKEIKKLRNVVTLYHNNIHALCSIKCESKSYEGYPSSIDENYLSIVCQDEKLTIPLWEIEEFLILEI